MRKRWWILAIAIVFLAVIAYNIEFEYAYIPDEDDLLNDTRAYFNGYDVWGEMVPINNNNPSGQMIHSNIDSHQLSPESGAVRVDEDFIQFGREQFYTETFNNEEYMTEILGVLDGGITLWSMSKAIIKQKLSGEPTNNLQVALAKDITIGDRTYKKGELIDTGLDLPKGALSPMGVPISYSRGKVQVGASCASCHATVDESSGKIVEGAPNANFNAGMVLALAPNSAAYFTNTEVEAVEKYVEDVTREVETSDGGKEPLPDAEKFEAAVDEYLASWPKGNFDSTMDLTNNPTQIPDSFTFEDHPYGWNGFASVGPFRGLSSLNNNVHAQNSDLLAQFEQSNELFDIDKEVYIGTILQNSASPDYRYDPESDMKPSDFFAKLDDSPEVPGVNEMIRPPHFPKLSLFSPNGTIVSSPGFNVAEQINAMSAFQNMLRPPSPEEVATESIHKGREVFETAGCTSCHAGRGYTNHQVIPQEKVKTEPSRAKAFRDTVKLLDKSLIYSPDTPVPIPDDAKILEVPTDHLDEETLELVLAQGNDGGYKVKGLIGLAWSAPYLHDGGVAVGPDMEKDIGIPGTLDKAVLPDPRNSLQALLDRKLREKVVAANKGNANLQKAHVTGEGHEHWIDEEAGFTEEEREAVIDFLISLTKIEGN
ncbi:MULTISPECIES: electron transport protein [Bacillaceae]|uniref:Electron transport protein n=1 Tax=Evansella alkalicola TaxID=745819 RepID=A0ABS6JS03_9BACI|nr:MULTISPECIES: electron transport protein [Bacillaceae]MBU9719955.1 electron transport protein [Bacillus alkalicola]